LTRGSQRSRLRAGDVVRSVRAAGDSALLIEVDDPQYVRLLSAWVDADTARHDLFEVIPTSRTLYLAGLPEVLRSLIARMRESDLSTTVTAAPSKLVTVDLRYDGPDLADVAERVGMSTSDLVKLHTCHEYTVEFFGFSPGQAFFNGLPKQLQIPRRDTPRVRVPSASVAIATAYTVIYPRDSPGGWNLLGTRVSPSLWDVHADPPNQVAVGDRVRFRAIS